MPLVSCDIYTFKVGKDIHPYNSLQSTQIPHFGSGHSSQPDEVYCGK